MSIALKSFTRLAAICAIALAASAFSLSPGFADSNGAGHGTGPSGTAGGGERNGCDGQDCRTTDHPKPVLHACADREPYFDRYGHVIGYHQNRRCRELPEGDLGH